MLGFQSTLPLRGATVSSSFSLSTLTYFNPHSPCGERRARSATCCEVRNFNPHSPCGERLGRHGAAVAEHDFNPHSPCGERHDTICVHVMLHQFQSTLPLRGATQRPDRHQRKSPISIHTPLAGSDHAEVSFVVDDAYFNPHSPCGERLCLRV